jgi:hypothetical protein
MKIKRFESPRNKARREAREAAKSQKPSSENLFKALLTRLGPEGMDDLEDRISKMATPEQMEFEIRRSIFRTNPAPATPQEALEQREMFIFENHYFNIANQDPSAENARYKFTADTASEDLKAFTSRFDVADFPKSTTADWLCPKISHHESENFHNYLEKTAKPFHEFAAIFSSISGLKLELDDARWNHVSTVENGKFIAKAFCTMSYKIKSSTHHIELSWDWENRQVEIFIIAIRNQGKGEGTSLIELCKIISNKIGIGLRLCPVEHKTLWGTFTDHNKLRDWYAKLGFTSELDSPYMIYNV